MTTPLESLVQPFQAKAPAIRVFPVYTAPKVVKLQIGRHGASIKTVGGSYSLNMTFYIAKQINEQINQGS